MRFKEYLTENFDLNSKRVITFGDVIKADKVLSDAVKSSLLTYKISSSSYRKLLAIKMWDVIDEYKKYSRIATEIDSRYYFRNSCPAVLMHFNAISVQNNEILWDSKSYQSAPIYVHLTPSDLDGEDASICVEIESVDAGESYHVNLREGGIRNLARSMPAFPDNLHLYLDAVRNDRFFNSEALQRWVVFK